MNSETLLNGWTGCLLQDLVILPKSDIVDGPFGSNLKASEYVDSGVPVIRIQNIDRNLFKQKNIRYITEQKAFELMRHSYEPLDIVITKLGDPLGKACIIPEEFYGGIIVADLVRLRIRHGWVDSKFIMYAINSHSIIEQLREETKGTTRPRVNLGHVRGLRLSLPPLNEQKRIVDKIEALQGHSGRAREALEAVGPLLEKFRQSVLASAFRGDLTKEWRQKNPDVESAEVLLSRIREERRTRWIEAAAEKGRARAEAKAVKANKEWTSADDEKVLAKERAKAEKKYTEPEPPDTSWLPELPENWQWTTASEACQRVVDCHNKTAPYTDSGIILIRTSNIRNGKINLNDTKFINQETYDHWSRRCPPVPGDVIFTREAPMCEVGMVPPDTQLCMGQRMMLMRANNADLLGDYLLYALQAPHIKRYPDRVAVGTGVKHLRVRDVESLPIPLPPREEQRAIVVKIQEYLASIAGILAAYQQAQQSLPKLNQSILAKAFRGELVPQDPNDEPASVLLERIKAEREAAKPKKKKKATRRKKAKT